jgi:hypothetical protein
MIEKQNPDGTYELLAIDSYCTPAMNNELERLIDTGIPRLSMGYRDRESASILAYGNY